MHGFRGSLLEHQERGVDFMLRRELHGRPAGGLLADEPGLGKTVMTAALLMRNTQFPTLIICPKALQTQWVEELKRFTGIAAVVLTSKAGAATFDAAGRPQWDVGVLSYSLLARSTRSPAVAAVMQGHVRRIVYDEGHQLRNPGSKAFAASMCLAAARHKWILTGTPVVNRSADMWALLRVLSFVSSPSASPPQVVRRLLSQAMLRRTGDSVLEGLPAFENILERVTFDTAQEAELYARLEAHCRDRAWQAARAGNDAAVMEALVRCRQMVVHPELVIRAVGKASAGGRMHPLAAELPAAWHFMSTKLRVVLELVSSHCREEKVLVFCMFIEEMELIRLLLEHLAGVTPLLYSGQLTAKERDSTVARFQSCEQERVLIVQLQAGGTGLNLQAASRVVISSIPWTPSLERQGIHRAFRLGQTRKVTVHRVVVADTIDERILRAQKRKVGEASTLLG